MHFRLAQMQPWMEFASAEAISCISGGESLDSLWDEKVLFD